MTKANYRISCFIYRSLRYFFAKLLLPKILSLSSFIPEVNDDLLPILSSDKILLRYTVVMNK